MTIPIDAARPKARVTGLAVGVFALTVVSGVAADAVTGTDWGAIRAEWDRFVAAMWRDARQDEARAIDVSPAEPPQAVQTTQPIQWPDVRIGDIRLPGLAVGDAPSIGSGVVATRRFTIFDSVPFAHGVVVTGHEFDGGSDGQIPRRSYCYAEGPPWASALRTWVGLAAREAQAPITYAALEQAHADELGLGIDALHELARTRCRFASFNP